MAVGSFKLPISAAAGGINYTVDVFTSSGTYTKPSDLDYAYVLMVGGGAGAGAGRRGAASSGRGGGYAINSQMMLAKFTNAQLSATETVTVGAGGSGASAQTTDNTNGAAGSAGGATNFKHGSTFQLNATAAGIGGTSAVVSVNSGNTNNRTITGNRSAVILDMQNYVVIGTTSIDDNHRGNSSSTIPALRPFNNTSSGGSITSANARNNAGALGGFYDDSNTLTNEISGTAPEATAVQPSSFYTFGEWLAKLFPWFDAADANYNVGRGGLGGGCGDLAGTITGKAGAAALGYGGGGGGGGASTNGANSGAGGAGTGGIVIIINVLT